MAVLACGRISHLIFQGIYPVLLFAALVVTAFVQRARRPHGPGPLGDAAPVGPPPVGGTPPVRGGR